MQRLRLVLAGMLALAATTAACGSGDPESQGSCQTFTNAHSTPATGTLTLGGQFFPDETVLLQYTVGGQYKQMALKPAAEATEITFTGLPSGSLEYDLVISCSSGQENLGTRTYEVL